MYKIVRAILLGIITFAIGTVVSSPGKSAGGEFLGTWSAGHLLLTHHNPYDAAAMLQLQRSQGSDLARPVLLGNPPPALLLALPLAFVPVQAGLILWMAAALGCLAACFHAFAVPRRHRILAYCFAPVFACLTGGELSPFVLLGFALFVLLQRTRPLLAGAALLLLSFEPHLLVVLAPVLLLDCLYRGNWRLGAGFTMASAVAFTGLRSQDSNLFSHYVAMKWGNLPHALALLSHPSAWLAWIPGIIAAIWALCFYWSKRRVWNWTVDAVPLLFLTILVAPLASVSDQVLLLPAVLVTISLPSRARYTATWFCAINAAVLTLIITQQSLGEGLALGTSMAWFAWYLYGRSGRVEASTQDFRAEMIEA